MLALGTDVVVNIASLVFGIAGCGLGAYGIYQKNRAFDRVRDVTRQLQAQRAQLGFNKAKEQCRLVMHSLLNSHKPWQQVRGEVHDLLVEVDELSAFELDQPQRTALRAVVNDIRIVCESVPASWQTLDSTKMERLVRVCEEAHRLTSEVFEKFRNSAMED